MTREICTAALCLALVTGRAAADPDLRDGMPEPLPASGMVSGTLLPLSGEHIRFAVLGDYGNRFGQPAAVAAMIRSWEPEFIVTTGDNSYGPVDYSDTLPDVPGMQTGWDENVGRYYGDWILRRDDRRYETLTGTVQRFFPSVGNHDHTGLSGIVFTQPATLAEGGYRDFFFLNPGGAARLPEDRGAVQTNLVSYYALRKGPVDFFMLDSNQPFLAGGQGVPFVMDQNAWFEAQATASTAPWKLVVYHHPPPRGFQVPWDWIPPSRLALCHAVLAGHDHVYERYIWNGVPVMVSGNGGASLFPRLTPFYADTIAVDDRHYGAVLVQAGPDYLEFEARSLNLPSGEEIRADRFVLGNAAAIPDREDEFVFYADAGESVVCRTLIAGGALEPRLTLFDPDGRVIVRAAGRTGDRQNALLSATITRSGRWKLRIAAETDAGGAYQISTRLYRPGEGYGKWSSHLPEASRLPPADANGDGVPNLITYALTPFDGVFTGGALQVAAAPGVNVVRVSVPALMRHDVTLALESSTNSSAAVWATVAVRRPFETWISPSNATLSLLAGTQGRQTLQAVMPSGGTRRFFRLRASLAPSP